MQVKVFHTLPDAAREIRRKVFTEEQGFQNEFDPIDKVAAHLVLLGDEPIGTCRVFFDEERNCCILGRLAVLKAYRGQGIGRILVSHAQAYARELGGKVLRLHAQCRITPFYEKLGFSPFGEIDYEEDCPHIWMEKKLD